MATLQMTDYNVKNYFNYYHAQSDDSNNAIAEENQWKIGKGTDFYNNL